ncbi:uncharacterized protein FSUBG_13513 [Fusarium subglutinans]|uniref:Uncharacterized protein n=1 Tax=Gibberella subglutinans TaxID=42677 RepID=A0A8H5NVL2_GIBSU|nr:uncharacterized protein FSUBG_13513 [Fusarium subglutinans]KAF5579909.1 hypothetical protein FSUBG_13513 [Fusarium subglutinans]
MAYRQDDHGRTPLASDSQANNDAAYEDYMRRYRARNPNSNWEPKTRRMVWPMYNPTPWLSPTSPEHPLTPFSEWYFDPFVVSDGDRVVPRLPMPHKSPRVEPQRLNPNESPQLEYVAGEGYRQVEPGTRSGANQQHYLRRANEQRQENEQRRGNERGFLRDVQSEVGRNNVFPQVSRSYQVDRREPRDARMYPNANARAPIPDKWTATPEARERMDNVQRGLNL